VRLNPAIDTDPATPGIQGGEAPSDDALTIDVGAGPNGVDPPAGDYSGIQDVSVTGKFAMTARFSQDSIGLGPSALELGAGPVALTGEPFDLLDFSQTCANGALLRAGPSTIVASPQVAADRRGGVLQWFTGDITMKLYTQIRFNASRLGTFDGLGAFTDDCAGSRYWTRAISSVANAVVPIQMQGRFEINPGMTTDGRLRLFMIRFDDAEITQPALPTTLHSCTVPTTSLASGLPPTGSCDGVVGDDAPLSATVKVKLVTAEVIIGDA
jgi:hypothetical protein